MRPRVRTAEVLKSRLEGNIIPWGYAQSGLDNCLRKRRVEHQRGVKGWNACGGGPSWWKVRIESIIPTDAVREGVCNHHILETAGTDLEVVIRVTPRPKAIVLGVGKDRCMIEVGGI